MTKPKAGPFRGCVGGAEDRIGRLFEAMARVRTGDQMSARTAKLLGSGTARIARKVIEEAAEAGIEAVRGDKAALVHESVDLLYNLTALWSEMGLAPEDVWAEMDRREAEMGMVEKLPKGDGRDQARALDDVVVTRTAA